MHKLNKSSLLSTDELLKLFADKFKEITFGDTKKAADEPIYYFISNVGKRIRPLLLLAACNMFKGDIEKAFNPAFGIQLFHNFTLVHDDIMDKADLRRGKPTVHKKYGLTNAIISGDVMMIYAYDYISKVDDSQLREVIEKFNLTAIKIIEGQQMDIDFEMRMDVGEKEYLQMIEYKTSVLLAESLRIGSIVANASKENQDLIYNFGLNLGLFFQIKDDWLDAFGEGEKFGKKIGGDIIMNKKTMLFVKAWELSDKSSKEKILSLMNEKNEDQKIKEMLLIYKKLSVDKQIQKMMIGYYNKGLDFLKQIQIEEERKQALFEFAESIYHRDY